MLSRILDVLIVLVGAVAAVGLVYVMLAGNPHEKKGS